MRHAGESFAGDKLDVYVWVKDEDTKSVALETTIKRGQTAIFGAVVRFFAGETPGPRL